MSLLFPLCPSWQLSPHVLASSLPPELCCHEAGEALQLRTVWPRTGCFLCPAQLSSSRPPGLTVLQGGQTDGLAHAPRVANIEPWGHLLSSFLSPLVQPFWISLYVFHYKTVGTTKLCSCVYLSST